MNRLSPGGTQYAPVFVLGAPRSGTSALHALLCTADEVNDYVAECSYFTQIFTALLHGWSNFELHNQSYFDSRAQLLQYHGDLLRSVLFDIWVHLRCPRVLALKDPLLTPFVTSLAAVLPQARFVVSVRDPRDIIASRLEVWRRQDNPALSEEQALQRFCTEVVKAYRACRELLARQPDRVVVVPYAQLARGEAMPLLQERLEVRLRPAGMWRTDHTDLEAARASAWASPLVGRPLSARSVGRHTSVLRPDQVEMVTHQCGAVVAGLLSQAG